ncbi:MAG: hotdog fold thioesterase [Saprospiraceae bacterium]|nr:hotdog fold thioesterase [Saprospiraceae bacterium]
MIWKTDFTLEGINGMLENTLSKTLGIEFTGFGDDWLEARMPVDERTKQPLGLLHGGASVALAETLGSIGGVLCLENMTQNSVVGVEINANHLRSAREGYVRGRAKPIKIGRSIQVWQIHIHNQEDKLLCVSRLTLAIVPIMA